MVTQRQNSFSVLFTRVANIARSVYRFAGRVVLGGLALIAAGIVALAMTIIGVLIAIAALISRMTRGAVSPVRPRAYSGASPKSEDGVVLEARKTGHGWTVE